MCVRLSYNLIHPITKGPFRTNVPLAISGKSLFICLFVFQSSIEFNQDNSLPIFLSILISQLLNKLITNNKTVGRNKLVCRLLSVPFTKGHCWLSFQSFLVLPFQVCRGLEYDDCEHFLSVDSPYQALPAPLWSRYTFTGKDIDIGKKLRN